MKTFRLEIIFIIILSAFLITCNNFFHNLIPPDGDRILSFTVENQLDIVIDDESIIVTILKGTEIRSLTPVIEISPRASIIPVTFDYVQAAFPDVDLFREMLGLYLTDDLAGYVEDMVRKTPDFNVPALDIPIDFTSPVKFFVVSAQGTMREYTVYVSEDNGEPKLMGLRFAKYDNAELISDALCFVYESSHTVYSTAIYPVEMSWLSFALIPTFDILGESIVVDGAVIRSGIDAIQFNNFMGTQTKTITVHRDGATVDYTLIISFTEDPDTIRSITDFRFTTSHNPDILVTAVASIVNNESTGTITIQVFYSGARPSYLIPDFVTPGTVSVAEIQQVSGVSGHDFSSTLEYRVVSRSGQYIRTYTVRTEFMSLANEIPRMLSFGFSQRLNHELVQDTYGAIGDDIIMIDAYYSGNSAPEVLVPEFTAQGLVTVSASVQVSGASGQDFSRQIKYIVTHPQYSDLKREYWVQTRLIRDTSNDATITAFGFYPANNPGLADEITGRIDQSAGKISLYAPVGSGVTSRVMVPRFTAAGQVSVNGAVQTSGVSGLMFNTAITYTVVSANGKSSRTFTVTVRELQSTIYVNPNTVLGEKDGTSWADAFLTLNDAIEAAALFPEDQPKEIWITRGTYKPSANGDREEYFALVANTSYIGGFAGYETAKSQRNVSANAVTVSGNLGGVYSNNLFGAFNNTTALTINGDLAFEDIDFIDARATLSGGRANGAAINAVFSSSAELTITRCNFTGLEANGSGGAVYSSGGYIHITDAVIKNTKGSSGGAVYSSGGADFTNVTTSNTQATSSSGGSLYLTGSGSKSLSNITIDTATASSYGGGIYSSGDSLRITNSNIKNTKSSSGSAVYSSSSGTVNFSNLTTSNTEATGSLGYGGSLYLEGSGSKSLSNITIDTATASYYGGGIYSSSGTLSITDNSTIKNTKGLSGGAVYSSSNVNFSNLTTSNTQATSGNGGSLSLTGSGNNSLYRVTIDNATASAYGGGIYGNNGSLTMIDSTITNVTASGSYSNGGGIYYAGSSGSLSLSGVTIDNATASSYGGGICISGISLTMTNSTIKNTRAGASGGGVYLSYSGAAGGISGSRFENCVATSYGGGLYASGFTGEVYNTTFLNCTAGEYYQIMSLPSGTARSCTFTHNDSLQRITQAELDRYGMFPHSGTFIACTFTNLRFNGRSGENYLFCNWSYYPSDGGSGSVAVNDSLLTLTSCTFTIGSGGAGIVALYVGGLASGESSESKLVMSGARVSNNENVTPLIWLRGNTGSGTFRFSNLTYNGTTVTTASDLSSGVVKLENGATITFY